METSDTRFKGFPNADNVRLSETIIVADADYLDDVAFRFTVQGERILGRRVPKADLSQWAVDAALDGGLRADGKSHTTQVLLVHEKANSQLRNFSPSVYATELNAQAFTDPHLGEFLVNDVAVGDMVGKDDYILDVVRLVLGHSEVRRHALCRTAVGTARRSHRPARYHLHDERHARRQLLPGATGLFGDGRLGHHRRGTGASHGISTI